MQTHLTHINTIFEYWHSSVILNNVDVSYLEDGNIYIGQFWKLNRNYAFYQKKTSLVDKAVPHIGLAYTVALDLILVRMIY